jgi:hypothetical protein
MILGGKYRMRRCFLQLSISPLFIVVSIVGQTFGQQPSREIPIIQAVKPLPRPEPIIESIPEPIPMATHSSPSNDVGCDEYCQPQSKRRHQNWCSQFLAEQSEKLAELRARRTQMPQHYPYEDPLEDSYFFRPYQVADIARHQAFAPDAKNPYDNRFLQSIYSP